MRKQILILFLLMLCAPIHAQGENMVTMFSPQLREFLATHRQAFQVLSNTVWECFTNRTLQVYYFYSNDESRARAMHYYPAEAVVGIMIRGNQEPLDEFISFVFEAQNSLGEKRFEALAESARSGTISESEFIDKFRRVEFDAILRTKKLLAGLKLSKREINKSYFYKRFSGAPEDFEEYRSYVKKVSPLRDPEKHYKAEYESLREESLQEQKSAVLPQDLNSTRQPKP